MKARGNLLLSLYQEALDLTIEARNYCIYAKKDLTGGKSNKKNVHFDLMLAEMTLVSRLTHVMSWLLFQRAVYAGEMNLEDAMSSGAALGGHDVALCRNFDESEGMPRGLAGLMVRSLSLYQRINHLDRGICKRLGRESYGDGRQGLTKSLQLGE